MARIPQVTRTIPTTIADVILINVNTGLSRFAEVSIPRTFKKPEKLRAAIEAKVNTDEEKLAHIRSTKLTEVLYGMSEQKFIDNAEILPPRIKPVVDEETAEDDNSDQ